MWKATMNSLTTTKFYHPHPSTQRRQQLQDWQEACHYVCYDVVIHKEKILKLFQWDSIRPSSLNLKRTAGACFAALNARSVVTYLEYYHKTPIHYWKWSHFWLIRSWNLSTWYSTDQNARYFVVKCLVNFQRKRVEICVECNFEIVKICQKCAIFKSGSLFGKLLRIEKVPQNSVMGSCPKS